MRNGIKNVIAMNGTKLPEAVRALSNEKEMTLFVDGDRGGKLIARNVVDNARIKFIAVAPDGKEVEELNGKEALICLRKKVPVGEFFHGGRFSNGSFEKKLDEIKKEVKEEVLESVELNTDQKEALKIIADSNKNTNKAIILDNQLEKIKEVSAKGLGSALKKIDGAYALVIDGTATPLIINVAEDVGVKVIVASNFSVTSSKINLLSL
jgi:DNA primase